MSESEADRPGIRVLVVDDHLAFADLLAFALSAQPDITCVGVSTTIDDGVATAARTRPDAVLLDIAIHGEDGLLAIPRFRAAAPDTVIAVLTAHRSGSRMHQAERAGAAAFVAKDGPLSDVLAALRGLRGERMVVAGSTRLRTRGGEAAADAGCRLTAREHDVLDGLGQGLPPKLIARSLGITVQTCRGYLKTVMGKLGTGTQLETVVAAQQLGLIRTSREI